MGTLLEFVDVLVLPYDTRSTMNSGTMLLAFSFGRTVILPNIPMAEEFDDKLFYKYAYKDEREHRQNLTKEMKRAFSNGRQENRRMGGKLRTYVEKYHSIEAVKDNLLKLI